jgi:RHS repeat-associated protein
VKTEFAAPVPAPFTEATEGVSYDADNRISVFNGHNVVYDDDGNMTSGPLMNDTPVGCGYDARNRLTSAGGLTYGYDSEGNRTGITQSGQTTSFVIDPTGLPKVLVRIKPDNTRTYYIYGQGLMYQMDDAGNMLTYHADSRGSTVAITDGTGAVTDRVEYNTYGLITSRTGTSDTPFLFNGRFGVMTDPNGLYYMRARFYNPYLKRFLNPDPTGFSGGLNFYCYANGNPVSYLDPLGLVSWGLLGKSTFGFIANGVVAVGGALLAETGVGAVAAVYGSYGAGANFGNIINALKDSPEGPTGPVQASANYVFPGNENANKYGQASDLVAGLVLGKGLADGVELADAAALTTAAQYDFATIQFADNISTFYQGSAYVDAAWTAKDAWSWTWAGETSSLPGSSTPVLSNQTWLTPSPSTSIFSKPTK